MRSRIVARPRKSAKPFTEPMASAHRAPAPISETRSAATIVRNERVKPRSTEERTVRPVRTSSFNRS